MYTSSSSSRLLTLKASSHGRGRAQPVGQGAALGLLLHHHHLRRAAVSQRLKQQQVNAIRVSTSILRE